MNLSSTCQRNDNAFHELNENWFIRNYGFKLCCSLAAVDVPEFPGTLLTDSEYLNIVHCCRALEIVPVVYPKS